MKEACWVAAMDGLMVAWMVCHWVVKMEHCLVAWKVTKRVGELDVSWAALMGNLMVE